MCYVIGLYFVYLQFFGFAVFIFVEWEWFFGWWTVLYLYSFLSFLVRMPIFIVHLWLPRAHVEAPVSGSIILAGFLLKLGGRIYGLLRVFPALFKFCFRFGIVWVALSLVGGLFVSLFCMRQTDLNWLIAYSSVAHISVVIIGIRTLSYWGVCRSFDLMVVHGL